MKNVLLALVFFLTPILSFAQTTYTVGEGAAGIYDFETVQAAHDAASSGDTIHVHPMITNNSVNISKTLYFVGSGYFITDNDISQQFYGESQINPTISAGAEGTVFDGLTINNVLTFNIDDITIIRCNATFVNLSLYGDNLVIQNCYLFIQNTILEGNNTIISNNIVTGSSSNFYDIGQPLIFENNACFVTPDFSSAIVRNNIFALNYSVTTRLLEPSDLNVIEHNLFVSTPDNDNLLNGINGNITTNFSGIFQGNTINTVFLGWPENNSNFTDDARIQLIPGSPATGAGVGGVDMGAFGGVTPYTLSGMPNRPFVYEINMPADNGTNPTLNVEVKIRAH